MAGGTAATRRALRRGEARVVLLAADASASQRQKVLGLLRHSAVPHFSLATRVDLGAATGAAPLSALAVTSASFAEQVLRRLSSPEGGSRGVVERRR